MNSRRPSLTPSPPTSVVFDRRAERASVQTLLTTHSTHITSQASLASVIALTNTGRAASAAAAISSNTELTDGEVKDLERYLDATKSNLLFARKLMLVEGPADQTHEHPRISNGDHWQLLRDTASWREVVRHEPNPSSGGHVREHGVEEFLDRTSLSPENLALRALLEKHRNAST